MEETIHGSRAACRDVERLERDKDDMFIKNCNSTIVNYGD